jgi:uncharacterized protein with von Willebrand factor type A (vWA) domain
MGAFDELVEFGRALRAHGLPVGTGRIVSFCRAASALAPLDRNALYWAGRATLVARKDDFEVYDRVFKAFFERSLLEDTLAELLTQKIPRRQDDDDAPELDAVEARALTAVGEAGADDELEDAGALRIVASGNEVLRAKSFEDLTDAERRLAHALVRAIAWRMPTKRARRSRPTRSGATFDMRRTLRASLKTEGEPFRRAWRARRVKVRPLVLLLDISGSMSAYSRALMQFAYAARRCGHRVEVFCFGTRLTRVTRALASADPDRALENTARAVADWEGGTRIGDSLKELLDGWAQHAAIRGAVVVLCSDGLERGDPALLSTQMARLGRLAHRVVWVNPLKGSPQYQPLARGMARALPHVDVFLAGHNVASLEVLADTIAS